ncbi:MAG: hypothetical protein HC880_04945 [Bacteroidia bacterium]|nr:hypothetical protein [Bacteroidia bacterium]
MKKSQTLNLLSLSATIASFAFLINHRRKRKFRVIRRILTSDPQPVDFPYVIGIEGGRMERILRVPEYWKDKINYAAGGRIGPPPPNPCQAGDCIPSELLNRLIIYCRRIDMQGMFKVEIGNENVKIAEFNEMKNVQGIGEAVKITLKVTQQAIPIGPYDLNLITENKNVTIPQVVY